MRHELQKTWLSNIGYNDILHATPRLRNQDAPCLWGEQYRTDVALSRQGMNRGMLPSQIPNIGEIYNPSTLNISQPINIAVMGMPGAGKDTAIASLQQSSFSPELIFIDEQYQRAKASGKLPLNDNESLRRSIALRNIGAILDAQKKNYQNKPIVVNRGVIDDIVWSRTDFLTGRIANLTSDHILSEQNDHDAVFILMVTPEESILRRPPERGSFWERKVLYEQYLRLIAEFREYDWKNIAVMDTSVSEEDAVAEFRKLFFGLVNLQD